MQPLLSKVSLACWTTLLALAPLANAAIASPPPLTKVPQTTSTTKATTPTVATPKATTPIQATTSVPVPVKTEAVVPATITPQVIKPVNQTTSVPSQATSATPNSTNTTPAKTQAATTPSATTTTPAATSGAKTNTATATTTATNNKNLVTRLELVLDERKVYAYKEDKVVAIYPVAVGKKGWETPSGNFQVIQMVKDPIWENPWNGKKIPASLQGPIGIRWIGFWTDGKNTIGFHGTPGENLLGQAVSHGCVRMKNKDVVALFEMVQPGTPVIVKQKK